MNFNEDAPTAAELNAEACDENGHASVIVDRDGNSDGICSRCGADLSDLDPEHEALWAATIAAGEL